MGSTAPEVPKKLAESVANSKAEYKRLGQSGLRVSVPIFGAMSIGTSEWLDWVIDEDQSLPLLKAAYERGLNTWDTANVYSNGISEEIIAKAIKKYSIPRSKVIILSKCWGPVGEEPDFLSIKYPDVIEKSKDYVNQSG
jgi:aryl-alcohol dehydrogenase-like predicted oxidoreductase